MSTRHQTEDETGAFPGSAALDLLAPMVPSSTAAAREADRRHKAHLARMMSTTLTLLMYQAEREHDAHPLQTKFVTALGLARDAANELAEAIEPSER